MSNKQLWYCEACGLEFDADPPASDDWGGEEVSCPPVCPRCGEDSEVEVVAETKGRVTMRYSAKVDLKLRLSDGEELDVGQTGDTSLILVNCRRLPDQNATLIVTVDGEVTEYKLRLCQDREGRLVKFTRVDATE